MSVRFTRLTLAILATQLALGSGEDAEVPPVIDRGEVMTEDRQFLNPNFFTRPKPKATESYSESVTNSSSKINGTTANRANRTDEAILQSDDKNKDNDGDKSLDDSKEGDANDDKDKDEKESSHYLWTVNTVVGCNIVLAILALLLNGITMFHYSTQTTNLPSILYFRNSLCDSFSAMGFLLQVPSVISILKENTPVLLPLFSYWICTVAVRMSVFMNCVLGVVRCIKIVSPFYLVNRKMVTLSSLIYLLVWIAIASLDIWIYTTEITLENRVYLIKSLVLKTEPGFSIANIAGANGAMLSTFSQGEIVLVQFLSPVAIPALLCLFLMVIQIFYLKKMRNIEQNQMPQVQGNANTKEAKRRNQKDKAAITILTVTTIYVLTTILSVAVWLVVYKDHLDGWRGGKMKKLSWRELGVIYFSSSTLPLVCSTLTPLTLLIRGKILHPLLQEVSRTIGWSGSTQ